MKKSLTADGIPYASAATDEHLMFRKVAWRIIPFLFLCFICNWAKPILIRSRNDTT